MYCQYADRILHFYAIALLGPALRKSDFETQVQKLLYGRSDCRHDAVPGRFVLPAGAIRDSNPIPLPNPAAQTKGSIEESAVAREGRFANLGSASGQQSVLTRNDASPPVAGRLPILSVKRFAFMLRWALRLSKRYQNFCTLVTVAVSREHLGFTVDFGSQALAELAGVIRPTIRQTDLIGELEDGRLALLLLYADTVEALTVIQRFTQILSNVQFGVSLAFAVGAACCPIDGVGMRPLVLHATSHPVVTVRGSTAPRGR